jgi:tetratricopeptide (TPR) repeat protein
MTGRQDVFQNAMNEGHSAAWDQNWERAAIFYSQAVEEFPTHPGALVNLGLALYELQKFEDALICYQKAAQLAPADPLPVDRIALICQRLGKLEQAIQSSLRAAELFIQNRDAGKALENWNRVIRLQPENMTAHSHLAMTLERIGQTDAAVTEFLAVASILQSSGDNEKALQAVDYAIKIAPNNQNALKAASLLKSNQPLPKPARSKGGTGPMRMAQVRKLETVGNSKAKTLDPISESRQYALIQLAEALFNQTEDISKEQAFRRATKSLTRDTGELSFERGQPEKILPYLNQAVDLQTRGDNLQASEALEKAVEAGLKGAAAYFDLGLLKANGERPETALRYLQRAAKYPNFAVASHLLIGQILQKSNQISKAAAEYLEALRYADALIAPPEKSDELSQLYTPIIDSIARNKDKKILHSIIDNVTDLLTCPEWKERVTLAREQLPSQTKGEVPIPLAELLVQSDSGKLLSIISNIRDLSRQGLNRTAMETAHFALEFAPTYLPLHVQIGELLIQQDSIAQAIEKFTVVSRSYDMRGETSQAINLLHRVIQLAPMDLGARNHLIDLLLAHEKIEEAIREYIDLADTYYHLADLDKARMTYTAALRLAQQTVTERLWSVNILYRMADIDMQRLDWRQALRVYEQIRTLEPNDEKARVQLVGLNFRMGQESPALTELDGYISYLVSNGQNEKAIQFLENLAQENPERISIVQRLVDWYIQTEKIPSAIAQLDKLAELMLNRGDKTGAIATVQKIIEFNPPNAAEYQRLLKQIMGGK